MADSDAINGVPNSVNSVSDVQTCYNRVGFSDRQKATYTAASGETKASTAYEKVQRYTNTDAKLIFDGNWHHAEYDVPEENDEFVAFAVKVASLTGKLIVANPQIIGGEEVNKLDRQYRYKTADTTGVLNDGITMIGNRSARLDQSVSAIDREQGIKEQYYCLPKVNADTYNNVNAIFFSQSKSADEYWNGVDGKSDDYASGKDLYNNNGYSEMRFGGVAATAGQTVTFSFDYALTSLNHEKPASLVSESGAGREASGQFIAQMDIGGWRNGISLDGDYVAGENGYTINEKIQADGEWHHMEIVRKAIDGDSTGANTCITIKFYHWVGAIAFTNVSYTAVTPA